MLVWINCDVSEMWQWISWEPIRSGSNIWLVTSLHSNSIFWQWHYSLALRLIRSDALSCKLQTTHLWSHVNSYRIQADTWAPDPKIGKALSWGCSILAKLSRPRTYLRCCSNSLLCLLPYSVCCDLLFYCSWNVESAVTQISRFREWSCRRRDTTMIVLLLLHCTTNGFGNDHNRWTNTDRLLLELAAAVVKDRHCW